MVVLDKAEAEVRVLRAAGDRIGKLGKDRLAEIDEWAIPRQETRRRDSA